MKYWRPISTKVEGCEREVFLNYFRNCVRKGKRLALSRELFYSLICQKCFYCDSPPRNKIRRKYFTFFYQGIDRKDNNIGYVESNVVPCCAKCNAIKADLLSHEEMLAVAQALQEFKRDRLARR